MAIYHLSTKSISRSAGRSAVAASAYRAGVELTDERTGEVHDYRRKRGVQSVDLLAPDGEPVDRGEMWNAAEAAEKRKDARIAREWVAALPAELDAEQRRELARTFGQTLARMYGVGVEVAIHAPHRDGDDRNHHAHVLTTTRRLGRTESGRVALGEKAAIEWSDRRRRETGLGAVADEVKLVRSVWEKAANRALERAGRVERVDARSHAARGLDAEPTTHMGPVATAMERRGVLTDRGDGNRRARRNTAERAALRFELGELAKDRAGIDQAEAEQARRAEVERCEQAERQAILDELGRMTPAELRAEMRRMRQQPEAAAPVPMATPAPAIERAPQVARGGQAVERQPVDDVARAAAERRDRMTAGELSAEISRLRRQVAPVEALVERDERVRGIGQVLHAQRESEDAERRIGAEAAKQAARWRQDHAMQARLHDAGVRRSAYLDERAAAVEHSKKAAAQLRREVEELQAQQRRAEAEARQRIERQQAPALAEIAKAEAQLRQKLAREREQQQHERGQTRDRGGMSL